jgi:hypothetical protein
MSYVLYSSDSEDEHEDECDEASGDESLSSRVSDNEKGKGAHGPYPQMIHGCLNRNLCIVSGSKDENKHKFLFMEKKPLLEKHEAYNPCLESQQERSKHLFYGVTSSEDENESEDEIENNAKDKGVNNCESATTELQRANSTLQVRWEAHLKLAFCTRSINEDGGGEEDAEKAVEALPENNTDEDSPASRIGVEAHRESDDTEREYEDAPSTEAPSIMPSDPQGTREDIQRLSNNEPNEMMSTHNQEQSARSLSSRESKWLPRIGGMGTTRFEEFEIFIQDYFGLPYPRTSILIDFNTTCISLKHFICDRLHYLPQPIIFHLVIVKDRGRKVPPEAILWKQGVRNYTLLTCMPL